jgi:hypothetical protein
MTHMAPEPELPDVTPAEQGEPTEHEDVPSESGTTDSGDEDATEMVDEPELSE